MRILHSKYAQAFIKYNSLKKFLNFCVVNIEEKLKCTTVKGYPYTLTVDVTNICQLSCPLCFTGSKEYGRKRGVMSFEDYKRYFNQLCEYIYMVNLYNWGEPLLNKDIFAIIAYSHSKNVYVSISTNFLAFDKMRAEMLVRSGLDYLIISLDGASQDTYSLYRKGGDFNKVIKNIEILVAERKKQRRNNPFIVWQFIVFKHNQHEINQAKIMARELGVNEIQFIIPQCGYDPSWLPTISPYKERVLADKTKTTCGFLWYNCTLHWNGKVGPCCIQYYEKDDFGDLNLHSFKSIWNNERFVEARTLLKNKGARKSALTSFCNECRIIKNFSLSS